MHTHKHAAFTCPTVCQNLQKVAVAAYPRGPITTGHRKRAMAADPFLPTSHEGDRAFLSPTSPPQPRGAHPPMRRA